MKVIITFYGMPYSDITGIKIEYGTKTRRNYEAMTIGDPSWAHQVIEKKCTEEEYKFLVETLIHER